MYGGDLYHYQIAEDKFSTYWNCNQQPVLLPAFVPAPFNESKHCLLPPQKKKKKKRVTDRLNKAR